MINVCCQNVSTCTGENENKTQINPKKPFHIIVIRHLIIQNYRCADCSGGSGCGCSISEQNCIVYY